MKRNTGPGRPWPGLLILIAFFILCLSGCATRTHKLTRTSAPQPDAAPHQVERPVQNVDKRADQQPEPEAGEKTAEEPVAVTQKPEDQPGIEDRAESAVRTETVATSPAGSPAAPAVLEPSTGAKPALRPGDLVREFKQAPTGSREIALTFDAGASPKPTPVILSTLKRYGLHCTFFLTGKWMEANPELTRRIVAEGHELANHSYSHPDFRKLSDDEIREQLERTERIALEIAGVSTKPLFRPPFGGRDRRVREVLADAGYRSIYWSVDSWDAYKKGITAREIRERVLSKTKGGDIVLMHCGSASTAEALPSIIEELQAGGYRLVKVSQIL